MLKWAPCPERFCHPRGDSPILKRVFSVLRLPQGSSSSVERGAGSTFHRGRPEFKLPLAHLLAQGLRESSLLSQNLDFSTFSGRWLRALDEGLCVVGEPSTCLAHHRCSANTSSSPLPLPTCLRGWTVVEREKSRFDGGESTAKAWGLGLQAWTGSKEQAQRC